MIFSFNRFTAFLRKYVAENRSSLLLTSLGLILLPIFYCLVWPWITGCYASTPFYIPGLTPKDPMWSSEKTFYILLWFIAMLGASKFYSCLRSKSSRISVFMTPASSLEKFASWLLIYGLGSIVIFTAAVFLSDAIRVIVYRLAYPDVDYIEFITPSYLLFSDSAQMISMGAVSPEQGEAIHNGAVSLLYGNILAGLTLQALMALGSAIWTKSPLLKTLCTGFGILCLSAILFTLGLKVFFFGSFRSIRPNEIADNLEWLFIVLMIVQIIFTWCVSYFRFKEWGVKF